VLLVAFGDGEAVLELGIRDDLRQQHGFVPGGVLSYAAGNALTFAAGTKVCARLITAGFTIDYLRPAVGQTLRARARVVRASRSPDHRRGRPAAVPRGCHRPGGALSDRRKAGLAGDATSVVLQAAGLGEADALRVWVLIHEQADGTWGAGGQIFRYSDLVALVGKPAKEQAGA